jgi:hypothetical protein
MLTRKEGGGLCPLDPHRRAAGGLPAVGDAVPDDTIICNILAFIASAAIGLESQFLRGQYGPNRYGPDPLAVPKSPTMH